MDGHAGLLQASSSFWDLLIVNRMLPRIGGLALVKALRETCVQTPVLFLTSLDGIEDRVEGLRAGGDDYLIKPFSVAELSARVEAVVRRCRPPGGAQYMQLEDLCLDSLARRATRSPQILSLTPREFKILEYMKRFAGQVVTMCQSSNDLR
ncbi:response regulator transcription factor [Acidocella sp. MX-AZ02]|uniref:response regulator transcription factor n=1 Tax=Acidocella sp. MX-AZ02 TaxID=1214225 RepID=UPI001439CC9B|nr:response regulator transcription factor [Acidocella sp. MX-AZ02]